jgi:hypothetical protein
MEQVGKPTNRLFLEKGELAARIRKIRKDFLNRLYERADKKGTFVKEDRHVMSQTSITDCIHCEERERVPIDLQPGGAEYDMVEGCMIRAYFRLERGLSEFGRAREKAVWFAMGQIEGFVKKYTIASLKSVSPSFVNTVKQLVMEPYNRGKELEALNSHLVN